MECIILTIGSFECSCNENSETAASATDELNSDSIINHPSHYTQGEYEVIDVIEDWNLGFHLSNALKYIARANYKGEREQDLRKAIWYIERELGRKKK
jgi:hypothetical protein